MSELNFDNLGFNFDDVEEASTGEFILIPAGTYKVQLANVEAVESKNKLAGRKFTFNIMEGDLKGQKMFKNAYLESANGADKTKIMFGIFAGFLKSCGVSKEERELLFKDGYNPSGLKVALMEKTYEVFVMHSESNGKTYANIEKVLSVTSAGASF